LYTVTEVVRYLDDGSVLCISAWNDEAYLWKFGDSYFIAIMSDPMTYRTDDVNKLYGIVSDFLVNGAELQIVKECTADELYSCIFPKLLN